MNKAYLTSIAYALGEQEHHYREAASFETVCRQYAMPDMAAVFGWGYYRRTEGTLTALAVESARRTLEQSGLKGSDIDAVVLCSSNFQSGLGQVPPYLTLLRELELERAFPIGVTWGDCTMLLAGLDIARAQVLAGLDNVLVLSVNRIEDEAYRFQHYALFSDGAASCLVTSRRGAGFEMLASQSLSGRESREGEKDVDDAALYAQTHERLLRRQQLRTADLEQVLCSNVFLPVLKIKEGRLGISASQLYLDNVARLGHCFSADSLINLQDYQARGVDGRAGLLMLTANATGLRSQLLLQRVLEA